MKRFFLLFCAVALACSIMIVPAMAYEDSSSVQCIPIRFGLAYTSSLEYGKHYYVECYEITPDGIVDNDICLFSFDMVWTELSTQIDVGLREPMDLDIWFEDDLLFSEFAVFTDKGVIEGYFMVWEFESESDTETSLIGSIGIFFTTVISWVSDVFTFITSSVPLTILCLALPVVGFAVGIFSRLKLM